MCHKRETHHHPEGVVVFVIIVVVEVNEGGAVAVAARWQQENTYCKRTQHCLSTVKGNDKERAQTNMWFERKPRQWIQIHETNANVFSDELDIFGREKIARKRNQQRKYLPHRPKWR